MSDSLHFSELRRIRRGDADVIVYDAAIGDHRFAYLYLRMDRYSVVWSGPKNFQFDDQLPYSFIERQFSNAPTSKLGFMDLALPKLRPQPSAIARYPHFFFYDEAKVTAVISSEAERPIDFDLLDNEKSRQEYRELAGKRETASQIIFARYDSLVVQKNKRLKCTFTLERIKNAIDAWEFAVDLPSHLMLEERTLIWITRNHRDADVLKHRIDFKKSLAALSGLLKQRPAPILMEN